MKTLTKTELQKQIGKKNFWNPKQTVNLCHYVAGIEGFDEKLDDTNTSKVLNIADFEIHSDGLAIKMMNKFKQSRVGVQDKRIIAITLENEKQIYEHKEKSVVGRAVVGGLLLGPIGAIVGGMTGLKDGQKKVKMPDLILSIEIGENEDVDVERVLMFSLKFKSKDKINKFFNKYYPKRFEISK